MTRLDAALAREGEHLTPGDLATLLERAEHDWRVGLEFSTLSPLDLARLVRAAEALATVTLDRDLWRTQAEAAHRERTELRSAMERDALPGTVLSDVCRERDEARAEVERLKAERAEDDAEFVAYKDEVLRLRVALLRAERERDEARSEMDEFALEVGYGERPEGQGGVRRLSGEGLAVQWRRIVRERDAAVDAHDALVATIRERIPYGYDDGADDEATADECVEYAADEIARLTRERDEARADATYHRERADAWQERALRGTP